MGVLWGDVWVDFGEMGHGDTIQGYIFLKILGRRLLYGKTTHEYFGDFRWGGCAAMRVG
jgi:hypothetical protein